MNRLLSIKTSLLVCSLFSVALSSCLKDDLYDSGRTQSTSPDNGTQPKIIEIGLTGTSATNFLGVSLDASNRDTTVQLPVSLASSQPATEDINVTIVKDDAVVTSFNTANSTSYTVPASSKYTIVNPGGVVTIPKGSYTGYLTVKFKPSDFLGGDYALGFKIGSIDKQGYIPSGNLKTGVVSIAIKNKYDGVYRLRGHHNRSPYDYPYDTEESLITVNGNTVAMYWNDAASNGHPIGIGPDPVNDLSWYGAAIAPVIVFDTNTDLVTNVYNQGGSTPITMFTGAGAGVSRYDAATKTIYVYWNYNANPARAFFDTLTFLRPR